MIAPYHVYYTHYAAKKEIKGRTGKIYKVKLIDTILLR